MFYMAVSDEDWKSFMDSIDEEPEEVETGDESEDENEDLEDQDQEDDQDKSKKGDESDDDDSGEDDEEDDSEEDDDDKEDDDKDQYSPRLKQFIKSDGTYDLEKAEKSYIESGKQAVQLDKDLKEVRENYGELLGAIKAKPDVAKALFGEAGAKQLLENDRIPTGGSPSSGSGDQIDISSHPLLKHLEAQMNNASRKEYEDFVEAHPEAVTDPSKAEKIGDFLKLHGAMYRKDHNGEIPGMKDSLEAAFRYYGWDLETKKNEELATAAKKTAATRRSGGAKKSATKKEVTKGEEFFARKLGVTLKK